MNWPEELFELRRFSGNAGGAGAVGVADALGATDALADDEGAKTQVLFVEVPAASRGPRNPHSSHSSRSGSVGFAAAEDVLAQGRERLQLLGHPTVDVYIAVPPVGTGTVLAHGEHREYFNFFAVTAPAPRLAPKTASQSASQNAPVAAVAATTAPAPATSRRARHRRVRSHAHKHRFPHGAVSGSAAGPASTAAASADSLPLPTGERLARVVSARSASSSSAG